jgi:hypothetical protein
MSRFELYGGIRCNECEWYGPEPEQKVPCARCFHPSNWHTQHFMGQVFFNRPDAINWNHKCENFKPKETP